MPGNRENASISRATGSISVEATSRPDLEPGDLEAAGHRGHLLLGHPARRPERVVDRGDDEILEHLDVRRIDGCRVDRHRDELLLARHHRGHDATARRAVDLGAAELALAAL